MPILRYTITRPSIEVPFFSYDLEYFALIKSRHQYDSHMTMTQDGLTRVVEMTFATSEEFHAWKDDPDRIAMNDLAQEYNNQNGIVIEAIPPPRS